MVYYTIGLWRLHTNHGTLACHNIKVWHSPSDVCMSIGFRVQSHFGLLNIYFSKFLKRKFEDGPAPYQKFKNISLSIKYNLFIPIRFRSIFVLFLFWSGGGGVKSSNKNKNTLIFLRICPHMLLSLSRFYNDMC